MTDVTCAACGSSQAQGAAFCAVCGQPFPRTGRPVSLPPDGPVGQVQRVAGGPDASGQQVPYRRSSPDGTTEPEVYAMTQKAPVGTAPTATSALADAPLGGVGRRFGAYVLDVAAPALVVGVVVVAGLLLVGAPLLGDVRVATPEEASALLSKMLVVYVVAGVVWLAWWVGVIFWEGSSGKTLGNLATGVRTVDAATRGPLGFGRALLRWLVVGISGIVPFLPIVVVLSPAFDSSGRRQGWHDSLAKAAVVDVRGLAPADPAGHEAFGGAGSLLGAPVAQPAGPAGAHGPDLGRYGHPGGPGQDGSWSSAAQGDASARSFAPPAHHPPAGPTSPAVPARPLPDPWAFPSDAQAPTPTPAPGGTLITGVPGSAAGAPAAPAPAARPGPPAPAPPTPATPWPAPAPAADPPSAPEPDEPEWDSTRMGRDAFDPVPVVPVRLELESGEQRVVDGPTLVGRNPQAPDDASWQLVAVDDPTRSVSKTHAEIGVDAGGLWVTDRGSTNGTVVSAPGTPPRVVEPGARVRVPAGGTIHVGDRRIVVHAVTP
ncbi:RDD family protein [Cellulosimicrobium arenosum]|uniref:RDD family protein n=1 Tax=Cellulosimicrobium arenosum TaxID=2708133 RepID=A0A927J271_9MICO|nr:RDD family protein [Cellulosimicrobium arenosum]MBD8080579.1 RDD family protein [Cellulosimicrobium arenosum]